MNKYLQCKLLQQILSISQTWIFEKFCFFFASTTASSLPNSFWIILYPSFLLYITCNCIYTLYYTFYIVLYYTFYVVLSILFHGVCVCSSWHISPSHSHQKRGWSGGTQFSILVSQYSLLEIEWQCAFRHIVYDNAVFKVIAYPYFTFYLQILSYRPFFFQWQSRYNSTVHCTTCHRKGIGRGKSALDKSWSKTLEWLAWA